MSPHIDALKELSSAKQQGYYRIGEAATLTGVTAKRIRHYESLRLLPKVARTTGDYRLYDVNDLHALKFIRRGRNLGFSMQQIGALLNLWRNQRRTSADVKRLTLKHVAELDQKISELKAMRTALAHLASHCHGDHRPDCPILEELADISNASVEGLSRK